MMPSVTTSVGEKKTVIVCPYVNRPAPVVPVVIIEEREDFQIEDSGKVGRVSLGTFDTFKEVQSHKDEVGLLNFIKMAEARGLDATMIAGKTDPGLMVDLSDIDTLDDLRAKQAANEAKLAEFAKACGVSVEELIAAVKSGDYSAIKPIEAGASEGEENNV